MDSALQVELATNILMVALPGFLLGFIFGCAAFSYAQIFVVRFYRTLRRRKA